ncbi:ABC transporter permease [Ruminiclostridium cellobioparum]|uniref:Dipeptide/oligopeptide/nickel ABC transporter permease n=1 Tax=Ruminiclostridium cellobioparum subsp. termitidis CT1112 TaxID=1195236 RepID=S0FVG6_RUMCE|nr:ABC transporter permease [Ruminiclostridium cellobioparum]EMS73164.1 dipeptide/oligopeptide/nickel ABC transporter permease [Ruminiclostridium cellobioparum subsp. termitidis CT1112]
MWKTILRRLLVLIPQVAVLSLLVFILASFMPGDALTGKIDPNVSPERLEELREKWGFYDPWYVKYGRWVTDALSGDLGESTSYKIPVTELIGNRAANTFWLSLLTLGITYIIGISFGVISGRFNGKPVDKAISFYTFLALAMPSIVLGVINIYFFSLKLNWFPMGGTVNVGMQPGTLSYFLSRIHHMLLPAITGGVLYPVGVIQILKSEIVDYKISDFVMTARSKGVPEKTIYTRHILRNAFLPTAANLGYDIAFLLGGSIFIERIFSYPGMGNLFLDSILRRDYAVVNALIILFAVLTVLGTLISDIIMSAVDPRIRIK